MYKSLLNSLKFLFFCCFISLSVVAFALPALNFQNTSRHSASSLQKPSEIPVVSSQNIPKNVLMVLKYVREHGEAPNGYVGGRRFGNYEGILPNKDLKGTKINYKEWDTNPKVIGKNRGAERLVTGSNQKAYFTQNHYQSFVEIK